MDETHKKRGRPPIGPQIWCRVTPETRRTLEEICDETGRKLSAVVREFLLDGLKSRTARRKRARKVPPRHDLPSGE